MKRRFALIGAALIAIVASIVVAIQPASAATGIRVVNGRLVEANGSNLVLRGVNHAHTWYKTQTQSFADIKAAGANSVRVVLSAGRWGAPDDTAEVTKVINLCKTNKLICVLENHDTTGFGEQSGSTSLDAAASYWISVQSALTGQENYVILNIGNEPIGNNAVTPNWTDATVAAVRRLRSAGFEHTIMVDSTNWGQDWSFLSRDTAPTVKAADTTGNIIFATHMYGVFDTAAEVNAYVDSFTSRGLAFCICEFGHNHSDGNPDEDAIMAKAQQAGIGLMAWSWSGNSGGVEYLDMVTNFNASQRTSWGTRFITGANGLSTTSREASIYSGVITTTPPTTRVTTPPTTRATTPPTTRATTPPTTRATTAPTTATQGPGGCTASYRIVGQWQGGFQGEVTVTAGSSAIPGWRVSWTFANGQTITQIWGGRNAPSGSTQNVSNESWNGNLGAGASTNFGFLGSWNGTNSVPSSVTCTRV